MADAPHPDAWRATIRRRLVVVAVIFAAGPRPSRRASCGCRCTSTSTCWRSWTIRSDGFCTLPAMRGTITDREGRVLATSADADTVFAVPTEIDDPESTARKLCRVIDGCSSSKDQYAALVDRLSRRRAFAYVKRQVSPEEAAAVRRPEAGRRRLEQGEPAVLSDARADGSACSATSASTTPGWPASSVDTTISFAAKTGGRWCTPMPSTRRSTASVCRRRPARLSS